MEQDNLFSHLGSFKFLSSLAIPCRLYAVDQIHNSLLTSAEYFVTEHIGFEGELFLFHNGDLHANKPLENHGGWPGRENAAGFYRRMISTKQERTHNGDRVRKQ